MSETNGARPYLEKYCVGDGLDLGCGHSKIKPSAIAMDQPQGYTKVGEDPIQLHGDATNLHWFRDGVLDYIYSSHLLEDFTTTVPILKEWTRVIKKGGVLVLYLPHELIYRAHCKATGQGYNLAHKLEQFSLEYMRECTSQIPELKEIYSTGIVNTYSFCLVLQKV
jgi:predicted SAM-dependent methyltransferase